MMYSNEPVGCSGIFWRIWDSGGRLGRRLIFGAIVAAIAYVVQFAQTTWCKLTDCPPTPTPTAIPVTPTGSPNPPPGWLSYSSSDLQFTVFIPPEWHGELHIQDDSPLKAVSFGASAEAMGADATVITVIAIPTDETIGELTPEDLVGIMEEWRQEMNPDATILRVPATRTVSGYDAVTMVDSMMMRERDEGIELRGYRALLETSKRLYWIEAVGLAAHWDTIEHYFENFLTCFSPR